MRLVLILFALFISFGVRSQTGKVFDKAPEFPGGLPGIQEYLKLSVKYPPNALATNTEGRVMVKFAVDELGAVSDVSVMNSVHPLLDSEAVRVVRAMPNWKPGTLNNKNVKVTLAQPIVFSLNDAKSKK